MTSARARCSLLALVVAAAASVATSAPEPNSWYASNLVDGPTVELDPGVTEVRHLVTVEAVDLPAEADSPWVTLVAGGFVDGDGTVTEDVDDTVELVLVVDGVPQRGEVAYFEDGRIEASIGVGWDMEASCTDATCVAEVEVVFASTGDGAYTVPWTFDASMEAWLPDDVESQSGELDILVTPLDTAEPL